MRLVMGHEELIRNAHMLKRNILRIVCEVEAELHRVPGFVFGVELTSTNHW